MVNVKYSVVQAALCLFLFYSCFSAVQAGEDVLKGTTPIKPVDVMGDKNRSGPDGWVQAPVTRDEAAATSSKAPGEPVKPKLVQAPTSAKTLSPGDDPGTPIANPSHGPAQPFAAPK